LLIKTLFDHNLVEYMMGYLWKLYVN